MTPRVLMSAGGPHGHLSACLSVSVTSLCVGSFVSSSVREQRHVYTGYELLCKVTVLVCVCVCVREGEREESLLQVPS